MFSKYRTMNYEKLTHNIGNNIYQYYAESIDKGLKATNLLIQLKIRSFQLTLRPSKYE